MRARIAGVGISASTLRYSTLSVFKEGVLKKKTRRRQTVGGFGLVRTDGVRTGRTVRTFVRTLTLKSAALCAPALVLARGRTVDFRVSSAVTSVQTIDE